MDTASVNSFKIVKNVKTSQTFNETEQIIDEMMENIHKIRQNRENNAGTVTEQKRIIGNEIRDSCSLQYN
jgi:hypothetical protein